MGPKSRWEYLKAIYERYRKAAKAAKHMILDEFCTATGYNRKYAITRLNDPPPEEPKPFRKRKKDYTYGAKSFDVIESVWEAAGYPCSVRLKAVIPLWLPWIRKHFRLSDDMEKELLTVSPRTMDYRLKDKKMRMKKSIYGRTRPGSLLKHHIPVRTDNWDVHEPGFSEVDTVAHCGNCEEGTFAYSVNDTDILTGWVETRAVLGKGEAGVVAAVDEMVDAVPFVVKGFDSDNGSEFVNWHMVRYCEQKGIQPFRGRPYKKDDNAHIEQKNYTHVRKILGWDRYDTPQAVEAINNLYRNEQRLFMNLFMPSVKLLKKVRVGSKVKRIYALPLTPFERVVACGQGDSVKVAELKRLRDTLDPFELSRIIEEKLGRIYKMANHRQSPKSVLKTKKPAGGETNGWLDSYVA